MSEENESTYKVLHRILEIHEYLNKERVPTLSMLAKKFGVSTKTIQRDVSFMKKELNLPIRFSRDFGGYRYVEEVIDMPAMKLSREEIFALLVARSSIEQYQGSAFEDPLRSFFKKLLSHLAPLDLSKIEGVNDYVSYIPNGVSTTSYATLETLGRACRDRRSIEISYRAASTMKEKIRKLQPRHLVNYAGNWYLLASNEKTKNVACFHLARMGNEIKLLEEFTPKSEFNLGQSRKHAFGAYLGKKEFKVRIRFDEVSAPYVSEKKWNGTQVIKPSKDGGLDFSITVCDLTEIKAWILSWGRHARALAPAKLVKEMRSETKTVAKYYA